MSAQSNQAIADIFNNTSKVTEILRKGVRNALAEHGKAGRPVPVWRDEKVVWVKLDEEGNILEDA